MPELPAGRGRRLPLRHQGGDRGADVAHARDRSAAAADRRGPARDRGAVAQDVSGHALLRPRGRGSSRRWRGIDLALWDIKGKALQQPVYNLLGGGFRKKLRVYSSNMFQFTAAATADRARKAKDAASLHFLASVPNAFIMGYCVEPSEISRGWPRTRSRSSTARPPCPRGARPRRRAESGDRREYLVR
jgi:Mandelate racemase / muconate lactonizing enzyme, N-terminal domain